MSENSKQPQTQSSMTDVSAFFEHLDGGVFQEKVASKLSEVALGVMIYEKVGKLTITFDLKTIGSGMCSVDHTIAYKVPTKCGDRSENNKTSTPMHVGQRGKMTFFPDNQIGLFDKTVKPVDA